MTFHHQVLAATCYVTLEKVILFKRLTYENSDTSIVLELLVECLGLD